MGASENILFYDGACGLCHGFVRFTVKRDRAQRFFYAPLQGETIKRELPPESRAILPDSIVLLSGEEAMHVRSDAVVEILKHLGGAWPAVAVVLCVIPKVLRDWGYDFVAKVRRVVFPKPNELCPIVPPELRARFLP